MRANPDWLWSLAPLRLLIDGRCRPSSDGDDTSAGPLPVPFSDEFAPSYTPWLSSSAPFGDRSCPVEFLRPRLYS